MYSYGTAKKSGNVVTVNYVGDVIGLTAHTEIVIGNVGNDKIPPLQIAAPCYFTSYVAGQVIIDTSGNISLYADADISTRAGCRFSIAYIV